MRNGCPIVEIYEDNSTTQITASETLTVDFDSVTGFNNLRIVCTSGNGFEAGKSYSAMLSAGTVGGTSVVGETIVNFTVEREPVNWAQVTAPSTAVDLSATDIQLVDTCTTNTDMRGTDNAALASVLGALADAASSGDPDAATTVVSYLKQVVNTLEGSTGIPTFPAEAAPANNVSMVEVLRAIHADVTGLDGDAMRGTDNAALASNVPDSLAHADLKTQLVTDYHLDHAFAVDYDPASPPGVATALWNELSESDGGVSRFTANALEQAPSGGGGGDATAANQTTIINHLTDIKGAGWTSTDTLENIYNDTNELQGDWTNGGRLDLILDDILLDTAEIGTAGAGLSNIPWNSSWDTEVESEVTDALTAYGASTVTTAQVNTEVADVLTVDTFAEISVPAATATLADMIHWIFTVHRNKITQTATTQLVRNDADSGNLSTSTVSDDATTFTRGELS